MNSWIFIQDLAYKAQDIFNLAIEKSKHTESWYIVAYFLNGTKKELGFYISIDSARKDLKDALNIEKVA